MGGRAIPGRARYAYGMNSPRPAPYAVLRVDRRTAKAMGAIAAASAHQLRERPTPNADPNGPPPIILHLAAGKTPYQAAKHLLEGAHRRNRDTVLCREVVLSASPSYFRPGREECAGVVDPDRAKAWTVAALAWARRQWPDQLASFVAHADEQNFHAHLLVVPRVRRPDGSWALNSKGLFDPERLRELQTSFGEALAPLGIRRGEPGSKAKHSEVAQFYGAVQAAKSLPQRPTLPPAPKAPRPPARMPERVLGAFLGAFGVDTAHDRAIRAYRAELAKWRKAVRDAREQEAVDWERMRAAAAVRPLRLRQDRTLTAHALHPPPAPVISGLPRLGPRGPG